MLWNVTYVQFKSHGKTAQKISQRGLARLTSTTVQSFMLEATVKFLPEAVTPVMNVPFRKLVMVWY